MRTHTRELEPKDTRHVKTGSCHEEEWQHLPKEPWPRNDRKCLKLSYLKLSYLKVSYLKFSYLKLSYLKLSCLKLSNLKLYYLKLSCIKLYYLKLSYLKLSYLKLCYLKLCNVRTQDSILRITRESEHTVWKTYKTVSTKRTLQIRTHTENERPISLEREYNCWENLANRLDETHTSNPTAYTLVVK